MIEIPISHLRINTLIIKILYFWEQSQLITTMKKKETVNHLSLSPDPYSVFRYDHHVFLSDLILYNRIRGTHNRQE